MGTNPTWAGGWKKTCSWWSLWGLLTVLYLMSLGGFFCSYSRQDKVLAAIAFGGVAVLPPIWFVVEYYWGIEEEVRADKDLRDRFKFQQDLVRYLWLAVAVACGAMLSRLPP